MITKKPQDARSSLQKALEKIIINRLEDGAFTDEEDVKDTRYYFSTLEGLDCLLIPFVTLPKNQFWDPLQRRYPKLKSVIIDDINFILSFNRDQYQPPNEHGNPYFITGPRRRGKPFWNSECSSFTLSVLANYLELRRKFGVTQGISKRDVERAIKKNYDWVRRCKRDNEGWAWVHEADEHPWPTWSLLDTFEEILWYRSTEKMFDMLGEECSEIVDNIVRKFRNQPRGSYFCDWEDKVIKREPYNAETVLDLSRLMLVVSLYKPQRQIYPLAKMLYSWSSEADFSQLEYKYHLREKANYIVDSSLVPSVFRTLVTMAGKLKPRRIETLDDEIGWDHEVVLHKVYTKLMESQINHGRHKGLWGIRNGDGITYELYFTERTIESLTTFLSHYKSTQPAPSVRRKKKEATAKKPAGKRGKRSEAPNNIDKYTVWIPQLAEQKLPRELAQCSDWPIEDLLEFYLYRLFNVALCIDGVEWGHKKRGQKLPDGSLRIPGENRTFLYDAKSSSNPYRITASEEDKFVRYAKEGRKKASAANKEIQCFLIVGSSFTGRLKEKADSFQSRANLKLVCMRAKDICNFANLVRLKSSNPSELQFINWSLLLSKGNPLIEHRVYETIRDKWLQDLEGL